MFPIEDTGLRKRILKKMVPLYLQDNSRARVLNADGTYHRLSPKKDQAMVRSQEELLRLHSENNTGGKKAQLVRLAAGDGG